MALFELALKNLHDFNIAINKITEQRDELLRVVREQCPHLKIAEVTYKPGSLYFHVIPPRRICEVCGVEEDGWNCGHKVLVEKEGRVFRTVSSRELFYKLRQPGPILEVGNSLLK